MASRDGAGQSDMERRRLSQVGVDGREATPSTRDGRETGTTDLDHVDKGRVGGLSLGDSSRLGGDHVDEEVGKVNREIWEG